MCTRQKQHEHVSVLPDICIIEKFEKKQTYRKESLIATSRACAFNNNKHKSLLQFGHTYATSNLRKKPNLMLEH